MSYRFILKFLVVLGFKATLYSQEYYTIDNPLSSEIKIISNEELRKIKNRLHKEGYILNSIEIDSSNRDSLKHLRIDTNRRIDNFNLILSYVEGSDSAVRIPIRPLGFLQLRIELSKQINKLRSNGFLKTYYTYDTSFIRQNELNVLYTLHRGRKYQIDSVRIFNSNKSLRPEFIQKLLLFNRSENLNENWKNVIAQFRYLNYIELSKNPDFTLLDSSAILNVYIRERKQNEFNAILGLLSNAYGKEEVNLTWDVKLSLNNLFRRGVSLKLNWQKNLDKSQFLYSETSMPFLFNTNFGLHFNLDLEKFDTSFLRLMTQVGLDYFIKSNQQVSLIYRRQTSFIESIDVGMVRNGILPRYLDYSTNEFGFSYMYSRLDRPFFTRSGMILKTNFLVGTKEFSINSKVSEVKDANGESMSRLYDSIPLSHNIFSYSTLFTNYLKLNSALVLMSRLESRGIFSENVRINEMFYFGGIEMPRGFDDNSIISPFYLTIANELQYYLSEYFYSNIFVDMTIAENSISRDQILLPYGFGLGLALKTNSNIFQIQVGTGSLGEFSPSISNAKVHLNYTNVF